MPIPSRTIGSYRTLFCSPPYQIRKNAPRAKQCEIPRNHAVGSLAGAPLSAKIQAAGVWEFFEGRRKNWRKSRSAGAPVSPNAVLGKAL